MYLTAEESAQSTLFLYEPDLLAQISELLVPSRGVPDDVSTAAALTMDACAHHRSKLFDVLTAIGASVSHGILISLFRHVVNKLLAGGECSVPPLLKAEYVLHELVDSVVSLIAYVMASSPHGHMLVGAGILPILLDMARVEDDRRDSVSRR